MLTIYDSITAALYREGPSPSAISEATGLSINRVRAEIASDSHLRQTYSEQVAAVLVAISSHGSDLSAIARQLSVPRKTAKAYIHENAKCLEAYEDAQGQFVDIASANLRAALEKGERWATELVLLQSEGGREAGFGTPRRADAVAEAAALGIDYQGLLTGITRLLAADVAADEGQVGEESGEAMHPEDGVIDGSAS